MKHLTLFVLLVLAASFGYGQKENLTRADESLDIQRFVGMDLTSGNGSVTFILQMDVVGDLIEAREWIAVRSSKAVFENNEEGTLRFEWFLREDRKKAILIEVFEDSDAAKIRVENLFASPIAAEWQERFTLTNMLVCGEVKTDLIELLEPMDPQYMNFAAGFQR